MRFVVYQDTAGEWRWRLVARNGRVVADGAEGYASHRNAMRAIIRLVKAAAAMPDDLVVEVET